MKQKIINMPPPSPGGQIDASYKSIVSALQDLVLSCQILPKGFPAEYHERFYLSKKHAEIVLEVAKNYLSKNCNVCPDCGEISQSSATCTNCGVLDFSGRI